MSNTATIFEILMIVSFGFAWPNNIYKSIKSRTAKGKSFMFLLVIMFGYVCGITSKLVAESLSPIQILALVFYFINAAMVTTDMVLFFRNTLLDKKRDKDAEAALHPENVPAPKETRAERRAREKALEEAVAAAPAAEVPAAPAPEYAPVETPPGDSVEG